MTRKQSMKVSLQAAGAAPSIIVPAVTLVLALLLTMGMNGAVLAQAAPQPSKAAAKPLKAAQDAMKAKKYDAAMAKLKEVQALPDKSPYDIHLTHEMMGFLYVHNNDYTAAEKELEPGLTSGFLKPAEVQKRTRDLAAIELRLKNYPKAIDFGTRAIKGGFADEATYALVEQAYYLKGDNKATLRYVNDYIEGQIKQGKVPKERSLKTMMQACTALKDHDCETKALERMVSYYPNGDYWENLLDSLFKQENDEITTLQLFRLASEVDVLKRPQDYSEMAQLAIEQGAPAEGVRILEK